MMWQRHFVYLKGEDDDEGSEPCRGRSQRKRACGFPESSPVDKALPITTGGKLGLQQCETVMKTWVALESCSAVEWELFQVSLDAVLLFLRLIWEEGIPLWWVDAAEEAQQEGCWAQHLWAWYCSWRIWEDGETREMSVILALNQLPFKAEWDHMKQNLKKLLSKTCEVHTCFFCRHVELRLKTWFDVQVDLLNV